MEMSINKRFDYTTLNSFHSQELQIRRINLKSVPPPLGQMLKTKSIRNIKSMI